MKLPAYRHFIETIVNADTLPPANQIDPTVVTKLKNLLEKSDDQIETDDLLAILNQCSYFSLASDFVMRILNIAYKELCDFKGVPVKYGPTDKDGYTP